MPHASTPRHAPTQTPHDRFFRRVFAEPEHAAGGRRTALLSTRLDWSSLRLLPTDLVDPELVELVCQQAIFKQADIDQLIRAANALRELCGLF